MRKEPDNRLDDFTLAQITEIDFIHDYVTLKLPDLSFEELVLDRYRYFGLNNARDRHYYLKYILPRLKLLYFDESNRLTMQYLVWLGGEHKQLVLSGEYEQFYSSDYADMLLDSEVS